MNEADNSQKAPFSFWIYELIIPANQIQSSPKVSDLLKINIKHIRLTQ